jgi:hypothetical protein
MSNSSGTHSAALLALTQYATPVATNQQQTCAFAHRELHIISEDYFFSLLHWLRALRM